MKRIVLAAAAILTGAFTLPAAAGADVSVRVGFGWPAAVVYYREAYPYPHHYSHYDPYARPVVVYREVRHDRHRGYRGRGHGRHDRHHDHGHYCRHD